MPRDCPDDPLIGQIVGGFRLVRLLGEGGMSSVYLGERVKEFEQRAAVKILREGLYDADTRQRFRAEQQVLATLRHPDIVQLIDAGVTADGIPYLVMDYIEGMPLDEYCRTRELDTAGRIRLMIHVLAAVEYAHQRQVAHCDLKFSNILVTAAGELRLLDFGITKLLEPERYGMDAELTRTASRPFTPEFASPEQLQGRPLSTATDIYSAGAILYLLLAGAHPFEPLRREPVPLWRATISEEPEPPSRRAADIHLQRMLRGDLDSIALKALRKEPEQRYGSAARFAADLQNYLEGRPVIARRGSLRYRAWKFVKRNRVIAAAAAILLAAVGIGAGGVLWESVRAQRSRAQAQRRFEDARKLTGALLVDFYSAVERLDHSGPALDSLVRWSRETLDQLAAQTGGDAALEADLAENYLKLGILQANAPAKAIEAFNHGLALSDDMLRRDPQDHTAILAKVRLLESRGNAEAALGRSTEAARDATVASQLAEELGKK